MHLNIGVCTSFDVETTSLHDPQGAIVSCIVGPVVADAKNKLMEHRTITYRRNINKEWDVDSVQSQDRSLPGGATMTMSTICKQWCTWLSTFAKNTAMSNY